MISFPGVLFDNSTVPALVHINAIYAMNLAGTEVDKF